MSEEISWHDKAADGLRGQKLVIQARKIDSPRLIAGSHAHRQQQTVARDNARAWIDVPYAPGHEFKF
jgi:hypothetical protein